MASTGAAWPQQAPRFPLPAYDTGNLPEDIAASDVTGDGHLDLVTADRLAGSAPAGVALSNALQGMAD